MRKLLLLSTLVLFSCSKEDNSALIDSYNSQISSLNAQISQLNTLIVQSQSQITSLQSQVNSISELEATINNLNSQITDYQSQITSLQAEVNSLNEQVSNNSSLQSTIDSLNAQITALENNQTTTSTDTTSDTENWPDYFAQGHTFKAIGIWRLYSVDGIPVSESERFNIKIYPDALNQVLLTDTGSAADNSNSGWLDFGETKGIGWSYYVEGGENYNPIIFNPELINGVSFDGAARSNAINTKRYGIRYYNKANPIKIEVVYLNGEVDKTIFPSGLEEAIFYKITD